MKKLLILVLISLLVILALYVAMDGLKVGTVEILSVRGIQNKNNELDYKVNEATSLATKDYEKAVNDVQSNGKKLSNEKKKYEDMTAVSTEGEIKDAAHFQTYEIEYLWTKVGNHATDEGATMKMDITKGDNTTEKTYNLNFTVNGSYISITDFISAIENDDSLGFKIEEFKMVPNEETLQATFVCKNVTIKDVMESLPEQKDETEDKEEKEDKKEETKETDKNKNTTNSTSNEKNTNTNTDQTKNNTNTKNETSENKTNTSSATNTTNKVN